MNKSFLKEGEVLPIVLIICLSGLYQCVFKKCINSANKKFDSMFGQHINRNIWMLGIVLDINNGDLDINEKRYAVTLEIIRIF